MVYRNGTPAQNGGSSMTSRAWYVFLPGEVYANGPVRFPEPISERKFRAWVRRWISVDRLPRYTQVWRA